MKNNDNDGPKKLHKKMSSEDEDSDSISDESSCVSGQDRTNRKIKENKTQFSVLRNDSDGLRMKFSAIRNKIDFKKCPYSDNNNLESKLKVGKDIKSKGHTKHNFLKSSAVYGNSKKASIKMDGASESESNSEAAQKHEKKMKKIKLKRKKTSSSGSPSSASVAINKTKNSQSSDDSENESKNIEKSSPKLPPPPPISLTIKKSSFGSAVGSSTLPDNNSCLSSSDNELPALVNAAIKCVESDSSAVDINEGTKPKQQYTSSLLQDFMVKTQMLATQPQDHSNPKQSIQQKKKRGRPRKSHSQLHIESTDSGITSTAQSSSPSPKTTAIANCLAIRSKQLENEFENRENQKPKIDITSLDKRMYATERTLYPPPRSKRTISTGGSATPTTSTAHSLPKNKLFKVEDTLDPIWRKIDVNLKFRRPSLGGYKSDGGAANSTSGGNHRANVCSKILAAKSGYVSDYGSVLSRHHKDNYSGYKSDASYKSRCSNISRAKSCYAGGSSKVRKFRRKRDRSKSVMNVKPSIVVDQDILQLAGLSLGQSSEESNEYMVPTTSSAKKFGEINRFVTTGEYFRRGKSKTNDEDAISIGGGSVLGSAKNFFKSTKSEISVMLDDLPRKIKSRRSSAASYCSSYYSGTTSRHRNRRRRKSSNYPCKLDPKLSMEIDLIISTFANLCRINSDLKSLSAKDSNSSKASTQKNQPSKKNLKKRKMSESVIESDSIAAINTCTTSTSQSSSKRRHKKACSSSPDDHKLPLKKRHYLLTPGEKSSEAAALLLAASKPVSPKKRHLQQSAEMESILLSEVSQSPVHTVVNNSKKRNRLEGLVSKIASNTQDSSIPAVVSTKPNSPPPGIFEPSVELEIQISKLTDSIITKSEIESPLDLLSFPAPQKTERVVETLLNRTGANLLLKRKRKKINRTGFPTVKKKKIKKTVTPIVEPISTIVEKHLTCDRVPHLGEASDNFVQRNKVPRLSVVSLERLQGPPKSISSLINRRKSVTQELRNIQHATSTPVAARLTKRRATMHCSKKELTLEVDLGERKHSKTENEFDKIDNLSLAKRFKLINPKNTLLHSVSSHKTNSNENLSPKSNVPEKAHKKFSLPNISLKKGSVLESQTPKRVDLSEINIKKIPQVEVLIKKSSEATLKKSGTTYNSLKQPSLVVSLKKTTSVDSLLKRSSPTIPLKKKTEKAASHVSENLHNLSNENLEQEPLPIHEAITTDTESTISDVSDATSKSRRDKLKKSYLPAGLFSDYFKTANAKNGRKSGNHTNNDLANHPPPKTFLPPPPYCEKYFRRTQEDFQLPYDIWYAHTNSKFPARIPSWNYKKIRTNIYGADVRPTISNTDHPTCNCKPDIGCGDDCLNRMVYTECYSSTCPNKEKCRNQKIQRHEVAPGVERFMTSNKGWGVRTKLQIDKGIYILEYVGEVVTEKEFKARMQTLYVDDTHHYCLHLDGGLVIDGHRMGSDGRFVNHSCQPNCEMQKWSVNGLSRMALFAARTINPGEELTYDYNFSLFNPSEGQPCRCGSSECRGVIGGKSQRVKPLEIVKTKSINATSVSAAQASGTQLSKGSKRKKQNAKKNTPGRQTVKDVIVPQLLQLSEKEKRIVKAHKYFLIRNLEKIRRQKLKTTSVMCGPVEDKVDNSASSSPRPMTPTSLAVHMTALRVPRNIKTRGLTQAATDPEVEKMAKIAVILKDLCSALAEVKDPKTEKPHINRIIPFGKKKRSLTSSCSTPTPNIDFNTIQGNIEKGLYKDPMVFDDDIALLLTLASDHAAGNAGKIEIIDKLSSLYNEKKTEVWNKLIDLVDTKTLRKFSSAVSVKPTGQEHFIFAEPEDINEDIIGCLCGLYKDEGLMIQCSKCLIWQHAECTKADIKADNYMCEKCNPNSNANHEIELNDFTDDGFRYYLSLMRGKLQVRQGDTVYVLRDIPFKDENGKVIATKKHTYETIGDIDYSECDIFRVERLWKNNDGKRFIFGHHYLRPHETFHEPTRKFYPNEVVRVPLYEVVPIELVMARCWVFDRLIYCKGRPVDCIDEQHVYICELKVDKSARFFSKAKRSYTTCTKPYAFRKFKETLRISKTYAPHDVDPLIFKANSKKRKNDEPAGPVSSSSVSSTPTPVSSKKSTPNRLLTIQPKTLSEKKSRLENVLTHIKSIRKNIRLKENSPGVNLAHLLTGRGARQRKALATAVVPN